jgi:cellulose synthase operon protein C
LVLLIMRDWWNDAAAIGRTAKLTALGFGALAAIGLLVKAAGGATWLAVVFAAIGTMGALGALVLGALQVSAEKREAREALWRERPRSVAETLSNDGIYAVGVETEAREALQAAGLAHRVHAPYVERAIDEPLRARIEQATARDEVTIILVSGASKAGKSRTLLEALRVAAPEAWLIRPSGAAGLASLARGRPSGQLGKHRPFVIWLDDIEPFVGVGDDGLSEPTLRALSRCNRPVLVVGTQGGKGRQQANVSDFNDPLRDLLRAHPPFELTWWLTSDEQRSLSAHADYPTAVAERIGFEGIGAFMIVASHIREKLADDTDCPEGLAVARAAVDWQRVGLVRTVPDAALRDLYGSYLSGPASANDFVRGIKWATRRIYANVALLRGDAEYEAYDYAVRYERERNRPIPDSTWNAVIDRYASNTELAVGTDQVVPSRL